MKISLIAAFAEDNVIGKDGKIPWALKEDLKHFRNKTEGCSVVMGRKTYESIGKPLPNRVNFVLTRNSDLKINGVHVISSLSDIPDSDKKTFIIGGGEIYSQLIDSCDELLVTKIHREIHGDASFPMIDLSVWSLIDQSGKLNENEIEFSYLTYRKI